MLTHMGRMGRALARALRWSWGVFLPIAVMLGAGARAADDYNAPTPLLPHPPNRPVFSQDHYKRDDSPPPEPPIDVPMPSYSQDKYGSSDKESDYSGELRKIPEKAHEWSEIEVAKGAVSLNSNKIDEARKHFKSALEKDPRNFVAMEYLAEIQERENDLLGAIALLVKAKHISPEGRWGMMNYHVGRIYFFLKNNERAEAYLKLALDESGHLTAANYLLGYLMYMEGRYFEAERYLHEARMRAIRTGARTSERQLVQAIDYYLGEIYARLGFTNYAISVLRQTEVGESWEVRNGAWRVHSELNHMSFYLTLALLGQYDSNVILLPLNTPLPTGVSGQAAIGEVFITRGGWQSSPAAAWVGGLDGSFYLNDHFNGSLSNFDVFSLGFDGWVRWWNRKDFSLDARFDANDALVNRQAFTTFQTVTGPTISMNYFPFQRWNWEFGFQYLMNHYPGDPLAGPDRRSGHTYVGFGRISLRSPNPRFRPTLGYSFAGDATEGENWQSRGHIFLLEGDWRLFDKTHLLGGITYELQGFPNALQSRSDTDYQLRVSLTQILSNHWNFLTDFVYMHNNSTEAGFSYARLTLSSGLSYTF